MSLNINPFQYDAANNLTDEMIIEYYIDDFNYSRFVKSRRNIFLVGDRGSGKTMTLLYNSWRIQNLLAKKNGEHPSLSTVGIYIPCNTPLMYKPEYQLLETFQSSVISEHFLALYITYCFADTLLNIPHILDGVDQSSLRDEAILVIGGDLPKHLPFFGAIKAFLQKEFRDTQRVLNSGDSKAFYSNTFSFGSVFYPLLNLCSASIPSLSDSHFLMLVDDAHSLNKHQARAINSWIAFRDHSHFSFKLAVPEVDSYPKLTSNRASILEGHDYTRIDLQEPNYSWDTRFFNLATSLITRRLENAGIEVSPDKFFPMSKAMEADLKKSENYIREEAIKKYGPSLPKQKARNDHINKYTRSHYFKNRPPKAHLPPYSGFGTLVFLSTGVIRNLLEPCFWMYDRTLSGINIGDDKADHISVIPPTIQTEIILELSKRRWTWLRKEIAQDIEHCTTAEGQRAFQLVDQLAVYFKHRLLHHKSEPQALVFSISQPDEYIMVKLEPLIKILRRAQLLYVREGAAKDRGRRETYYVLNRILWPIRGLDPEGQHARVSIRASVLWQASEGHTIDVKIPDDRQRILLDDVS